MTDYYYRGTSLQSAIEEELGTGRIEGFTASIYQGRIDRMNPDSTVARQTPVADLDWDTPPGEDRGFLTKQQGVTGGLTNVLSAAVGFSTGVPIVLYLDQSALNGAGIPVRYNEGFFDARGGAAAWVYGDNGEGEIRDVQEGLLGLSTATENGPVVEQWGPRDTLNRLQGFQDEREVLVFEDHIDISGACRAVTIMLEGRRTPKQALATFDGYHAGFGDDDEENIARTPEPEVLSTLHDEVRDRVPMSLPNLYTLNLSTAIRGKMDELPAAAVEYAYTQDTGRVRYEDIPPFLVGDG